jgi:hypothetical protein
MTGGGVGGANAKLAVPGVRAFQVWMNAWRYPRFLREATLAASSNY